MSINENITATDRVPRSEWPTCDEFAPVNCGTCGECRPIDSKCIGCGY